LKNDLYTQVQIAYSIPRKICLITVGENDRFNLFPTDLHGRIDDVYIISLRKDGKACQEVESAKKIVLSDINASAYKKVYALGKNHMQPLKEKSLFEWNAVCSKNFNLPLPKDVLSYRELELEQSFLHGIHKLLLFRMVSEEKVSLEPATLSHIHNCYATWRYKHRISSNLLLR
jgi:flavin reductase (DIM6/NTAB) family NADH-FMN oxidoreductase RutF